MEQTVPTVKFSKPALARFSDLLEQATKLLNAKLGFYLTLALVLVVVAVLGKVVADMMPRGSDKEAFVFLGAYIVQAIVGILVYIAIMLGLKDESIISVSGALRKSSGYFWSYVWVAILVYLVLVTGYILLIIPGIYWTGLYIMAPLLVVYEEKKGWAAARRSKELVKGYWWSVLWRFLVFGFVVGICVGILALIAYLFLPTTVQNYLLTAVSYLLAPLGMAYWYALYKELVKVKS